MGKQGKRRKRLLKKFSNIDDETLKLHIKQTIKEYTIFINSSKIAIDILKKYGLNNIFILDNEVKNEFSLMLEVANLRNITIPNEWYDISINTNEVIKRINEFKEDKINWLYEHNYLFDCYYEEENESDITSDKKIEETKYLYESIILKEFKKSTSNKRKVKTKNYEI